MKKRTLAALFPLALLVAGCSSVSVTQDFDKSADFSSVQTFAWLHAEQPETGNHRIDDDLINARIRRFIVQEMTAKGFKQTDATSADILVEYFAGIDRRISDSGGSVSMGMSRGSAGRAGSVGWSSGSTISEDEFGILTINLIDPQTQRTIWRGTGSRRTSSRPSPERITRNIEEAVQRILKRFPPK